MKTNRRAARPSVATASPRKPAAPAAGYGYYIGASSDPSYVLVLSVGDVVRCVAPGSLTVHQQPVWIFTSLAASALRTLQKSADCAADAAGSADTTTALGRLALACAEAAAGRVAAHGAPVSLVDYDRVEYRVMGPVGADVYGLAKRVGVVVGDCTSDAVEVECARGDRAHLEAAGLTIVNDRTLKRCPTA